ncbi:MAG: antitoxin [Mycobacteriales bacterium]
MSSFFDKAKEAAEKAAELVGEHSDKIDSGIDKAGDLVDKATQGRFADKTDAVQDKAHDAVGHLEQKGDGPTPPTDPGN